MSRTVPRRRVASAAAGAAREVPGVAYLSPAQRFRRTLPRPGAAPAPDRDGAGVRVTPRGDRAGWTVEVSLAVLTGHQAARVAREVRAAVTAAVRAADGDRAEARVAVTVTVTAVV